MLTKFGEEVGNNGFVNRTNIRLMMSAYRTIFTRSSSEDSALRPTFAREGFCESRLLGLLPLNPSSLAQALFRAASQECVSSRPFSFMHDSQSFWSSRQRHRCTFLK